jgi:hypothetical protein
MYLVSLEKLKDSTTQIPILKMYQSAGNIHFFATTLTTPYSFSDAEDKYQEQH